MDLKTGEWLTSWMGVYAFSSVVSIHWQSKWLIGEQLTCWMCVHPFLSVVLILKHWRETHRLVECSPVPSIVLICSNTEEQLTYWMHVHPLVLISGSDLVKHWRVAHKLNAFSPNLVRGLIWSNTGEQLTYWMHVHPILSVFSSGQRLESDSQTGYILISGLVLIHSITREQLTN